MEKAREFQKNIYFCFIDSAKAFECVDHNKLWKILKETGMPDHLTCLLRNRYAGQEATIRTGHLEQQTGSNYCFLMCIQISQEAGKVVWYSHLFKSFPQSVVIHTVKGFGIVSKAEVDVFSGILLLFL